MRHVQIDGPFWMVFAAFVAILGVAVYSLIQWKKWERAAMSHMNRVRDLESKQKTQWVPLFHYPMSKQNDI